MNLSEYRRLRGLRACGGFADALQYRTDGGGGGGDFPPDGRLSSGVQPLPQLREIPGLYQFQSPLQTLPEGIPLIFGRRKARMKISIREIISLILLLAGLGLIFLTNTKPLMILAFGMIIAAGIIISVGKRK